MTNRPQGLEAFSDAKVQALFDQFFSTAEANAEISDRLTQRVLTEVHTIYGQGVGQSSLRVLLDRWHRWWAQFNQRPLLIAFGAVACVAVALLTLPSLLTPQTTLQPSLAAIVPSGQAIVLTASDDTYHTYQAGEQFSVRANDQIIVRIGSVELEPLPAQITEIMPGSQIALSAVELVNGEPTIELNVLDGQVRHRAFGQQSNGGAYIISAGDIRAFAQNNDIQIDMLSPARAIVTAFAGSAWVEAQGDVYEVKAGRSAEFGGRVMIIRDITPVEEGPGQIALAPPLPHTPLPGAPLAPPPTTDAARMLAPTPSPIVDGDQSTAVTAGASEVAATAGEGPVLTVNDVTVQESGATATLLVNGTGAPGSAVQVLIEETPLVTTTVTAAGTWIATASLPELGHFVVNVAALDDTGDVLMTVAAAELQVLPPATSDIPPTATHSPLSTQVTPHASNTPAAATATPLPLHATQTPTPIGFFVAPPTPTATSSATATRPVAASLTPTATGTRLVAIAPTATRTPTPTTAQTATPTAEATLTPTSTRTSAPMPTATATATDASLWPTLTPTRTPTATLLPTATPTRTSSPTPTSTAANTPLWPTLTPTLITTDMPTLPPTATPTPTALPTATATDASLWPTLTPTATPLAPTATSTPTAIPPTPTTAPIATVIPPTPTTAPAATPTATPTDTAIPPTPTTAPAATPTATNAIVQVTSTALPPASYTDEPTAAPTVTALPPEPTPTTAPAAAEPSLEAATPEGSVALPDAATETPAP